MRLNFPSFLLSKKERGCTVGAATLFTFYCFGIVPWDFALLALSKDWLGELRDEPEHLLSVNAGHPSAKLLLMVAHGEVDPNHMVSFGDVLANPQLGRQSDEDTFIFLTGGMGVEDVAWGYDVYQEALRLGIGQELTLWDKPHWA